MGAISSQKQASLNWSGNAFEMTAQRSAPTVFLKILISYTVSVKSILGPNHKAKEQYTSHHSVMKSIESIVHFSLPMKTFTPDAFKYI